MPFNFPKQIYSMFCSLCTIHTYSVCVMKLCPLSFQACTILQLCHCTGSRMQLNDVFSAFPSSHTAHHCYTLHLACLQNRKWTSTHLHLKMYHTLYCTTAPFDPLRVQRRHVSSLFSFLVPMWWNEYPNS